MQKHPQYFHYYDFFVLLFNTGLRISEAIGLRWQDIDFSKKQIHVYESSGRDRGSTSTRVRKTTKTGNYRIVPINEKLFEILTNKRRSGPLIFYSPNGKVLDDHSISQRCWRKTLELANVTHRPMMATRSTFVSHAIASGILPQDLAAITGHTLEVLFKYYLGSIKKPNLPEL
jgi:integrase